MSATDKGVYKLVARNEKGEATSQVVEVTEIPDQGEKPKIVTGLKSIVNNFTVLLYGISLFISIMSKNYILFLINMIHLVLPDC